ncbi:MAG: hypothetical protein H6816_11965 [Phycisphaerales bacterium]|nr:hypothetical protein [Phycisphaerales bacterium]
MTPAAGFGKRYSRLVLTVLAVGLVAGGIGYLPTQRLGGSAAVAAMLAGCGIAVLAGWIGGLVSCQTGGTGPQQINRVLGATALRLVVAAGLALATALADILPLRPLLLWVALAYLLTLAGETWLVVRWIGADGRGAAERDGNER